MYFSLAITLVLVKYVCCYVDVAENMNSFSHAKKAARCKSGEEIELFEHNKGPGIITEQWFTGSNCFNEHTTVLYYIDGDKTPTIDANLFMLHGIGVFDNVTYPPGEPWGTKWIGHLASGGGLYNTMRIPFQESIRVTFISKTAGYWWFILRGVENYPLIVGDLRLPSTAKLVLHKFDKINYAPFTYIHLAHSTKNGMVFMVTLAGKSTDFNYLEGCYRLMINNNSTIQYLSSGTEDFFLSAYYYNKGMFHTDHSGLTAFKNPGTMSAYKYFVDDPILFRGSFDLIWRVGEKNDNNCYNGSPEKCYVDSNGAYCASPNVDFGEENVQLADTELSSYVWFYEW